MTTKIRPASLQDVVAMMEIENSTNQTPWTKNQFISSMEIGHYSMVLQQYQKIIGFAIYSPIIPESHLLNIAINPAFQGKGLGSQLLEKIIFQNKIIGVKVMTLEVRVSNKAAIKLYEKRGFTKDAIRPEYYGGTPKEDALLMSLQI